MQEAYDGKPFFIVQKSLVDQLEKLPVYADSSNQLLIQLLDVHKYILSEYYAAIGLQEAQQMKKERLITAEVEDGAELPLFNIQDMIDSITAGIDRVNSMFDTDMQVVVNPLILRNLYGDQSEKDGAAPELEEEPETIADDQSEEPAEEPAPEDTAEVVADAADLIEDAAEIIEQAADLIGGGDEDDGSEDPISESAGV